MNLSWSEIMQHGFKMAICNEIEWNVLIQTEFLTLEEAKLNDVNVSCS